MDIIFEDDLGEEICKHNNVSGFPFKIGEQIYLKVQGDTKIWDIKLLDKLYMIRNIYHSWTVSYPGEGMSVNCIQRTFVVLIEIEPI